MRRSTILGASLFLTVVPTIGCSTVSPASFNAKAPGVVLEAGSPAAVSVSPQFTSAPESRLNANGITFKLDRNEFSAELARLLAESLGNAGVPINGDRSVRVEVVYLDFMFRGPCILDYNVSLAERPPFGMQAQGESSNFAIACRRAIEDAVQAIVADSRMTSFLEGK